MEDEGYRFLKDEHNRRSYKDSDVTALRKLIELLDSKMDYDSAIKKICASDSSETVPGDEIAPVATVNERYDSGAMKIQERYEQHYAEMVERYERNYAELRSRFDQQDAMMRELMRRQEAQGNNITQILREMLEARQQLAAAQDKPWWKFWK